jgi:hypothetical protein
VNASCPACGAPVFWVRAKNGKQMPIDAHPDLAGNITVELIEEEVAAVIHHPGGAFAPSPTGPLAGCSGRTPAPAAPRSPRP